MSKFLDELLAARSSGPHSPKEIDRTVIEQGGELLRLRAIVGALCQIMIDKGVIERGELMAALREALHEIDPLMLPSLRRVPMPATGPLMPPGANPYRDVQPMVPDGERQVICIRCSRSVARKHTNLTDEGPICDTCWEPRI
ncbi:MAG TPA: hypothetical protein VN947_27235 [Polyangia bacterium]|nr:hypothetical protein [Polyangia bacterium]